MDLVAVRVALAATVAAHEGIRASGSALDNPEPPVALVWPATGVFLTFDTMTTAPDSLNLTVTVLVAKQTDRGSQEALDAYLAGTSIWAAITDQTLGGLCSYCQFVEARNYGLLEWAGIQYLGFELLTEVHA
jgi:hypothetical protein